MELTVVPIVKPDAVNFIFGESHFIKTVEDLHEALVGAVPGIRFGLAFCEASGKRLVRWSGNDEAAVALARDNALAVGAGTAARMGVRRQLPLAGIDRWPAGTSVRSRNRACHCKRRTEPAAGDRHLVVTRASAATCSCAD